MKVGSGQANVLDYWRDTVAGASSDDVDEVGHPDMGRGWNAWAYRLRKNAVVAELKSLNLFRPGINIFEAAYGVGFYLEEWRNVGYKRIAGIDISERAYESCARRFPEAELHLGALQGLGRSDGWDRLEAAFDVATAIDVAYHIIDDDSAADAIGALAAVVRPGGILMITDKVTGLEAIQRESRIVTRRPLSWYRSIVGPLGFSLERTRPIFWCMDPPAHGSSLSTAAPRAGWVAMRALLKYLPRNSAAQKSLGWSVGSLGYAVDRVALAVLRETHNLSLMTFRRA